MADSNNALIICRDLKSLRRLSRFHPQTQCRYILASDDPRVHEAAKKYRWITRVTYIEKIESYYNVGNEVISIQEIITHWLKTLADDEKGFPADLLFFTRHVEGGLTTQRIQDVLLLIRSYFHLFDIYSVNKVIILRSPLAIWEDDVLVQTASMKKVLVQEIGKASFMNSIIHMKFLLKSFAYEPYYFLNFLIIKFRNLRGKRRIPQDNEIVFQLCSSSAKHIENILHSMRGFDKKRFCPVALCWEAGKGVCLMRMQGFHADELENWLSLLHWVQSLKRIIWTWKRLIENKREFISKLKLSFFSVPLNTLLWPSVRHLIIAEMGQRYRLMKASKDYFNEHKPLAITTWGINDLPQGKITLNSMDKPKKTMLFKYSLSMILLESPYRIVYEPVDLYLVGGEYQKTFNIATLRKPPEKIEIVGQARYSDLDKFKKNVARSMSYSHLKIPSDFSYYILFDLSGAFRGYISMQETSITANKLIEFVKRNKRVALIVKPHPSVKKEKNIFNTTLPNIFVLDKDILPYHALNCSDFLITKYSTLGIEAMLFEKPVISVILDREKRWRTFQNAADYFYTMEGLIGLLTKIVNDRSFYMSWKKQHIDKQKQFLTKCFSVSFADSSQFTANAIKKHLSKHNKFSV